MPLYQHRFSGTFLAGDTFVWSWWANSVRSTVDANTSAVTWIGAFTAGATGLLNFMAPAVKITKVSTGLIDPLNGRQQQLVEATVFFQGASAAGSLPNEVALVVSLRTALANRRGRGRFYLPPLAVTALTPNGTLLPAVQTNLVGALQNAWNGYNTGLDRPVVYSRSNRSTQNITTFDIGDVMDVQTRRDNKVSQVRSSLAMP